MDQVAPEVRGGRRGQFMLSAAAVCVALPGSFVLWLAAVVLPPAASGGVLGLVGFAGTTIAVALPALVAGVLFGRRSPRWGWVPAMGLMWLAATPLEVAVGYRHAAVVFGSALVGWAIGAYTRPRARRAWPATTAASVAVVAAALVVGFSDYHWLVAETWRAAQRLGAAGSVQRCEVSVEAPLPVQSGHTYAHGRVEGPPYGEQGVRDSTDLWVDYVTLRRRTLDDRSFAVGALAVRTVEAGGQAKPPTRMAQALGMARAAGVPERWLKGPWQEEPEAPSEEGKSPPRFVGGGLAGTWAQPSIRMSGGVLQVEVGMLPPH